MLEKWNSFEVEEVTVDILLPFEVLGSLWSFGELQRAKSLFGQGGPAGVHAWWVKARHYCRWAREHPELQYPGPVLKTMGFVVFCDGAEQFTNQEMVLWLFSSAHTKGTDTYDYPLALNLNPIGSHLALLILTMYMYSDVHVLSCPDLVLHLCLQTPPGPSSRAPTVFLKSTCTLLWFQSNRIQSFQLLPSR